MNDLIERQAAIDALDCINGVEEVLRSLPPAQPEPCEDAVSRKAVQYLLAHFVDEDKYVNACDGLKHLPPVQPETTTVTIGRTKGSVTMWYECDACGEPVDQKDNYCRNCGRKLKHE